MATERTIEIAQSIQAEFAGRALTHQQARLYSHRLRLDMGQEGLPSFENIEIDSFIDQATLLIQCALIEKHVNPLGNWQDAIKRAAEIFEWLSQQHLKPVGAPLHLLSAASYQLAGYPAMALGHLRFASDTEPTSRLLREFLRADFPETVRCVREFWQTQRLLESRVDIETRGLSAATFEHIVMCIGTIANYLRTGEEGNVTRALNKLDALAGGFLHSRDAFSYLLAKLTAETAHQFVDMSIWPQIARLQDESQTATNAALKQFGRAAFANKRALVWPAQVTGINRLRENESFVLCTPTGSGKTMVATLAIIQCLFADNLENLLDFILNRRGNLVLYLVPSRALAAEVEARIAQDLKGVSAEPVVVTGLYGGVDWGPTDAWIEADRPTIVICTFEKADALIRYLGVLFLDRVRLVVIDEAHMAEYGEHQLSGLEDGSSRSLRLEELGSRLNKARDTRNFRIVALSAVAARAAPALSRWFTGNPDALPVTSSYRSTRQMVGRLEVSRSGRYTIRYDLMDGQSLQFVDGRSSQTPYVREPIQSYKGKIDDEHPEVSIRGPTLWAALQLAAERPDGAKPSVLISITERIDVFSSACADILDSWDTEQLPNYFSIDQQDPVWQRCLASVADYFTEDSVEYRLLTRGIAVHHGKMPSVLARRLKLLVDRGNVRVTIATSTLSEGVNIPVNYLLLPSLCRSAGAINLQEFTNLIGRAGRPGFAAEGCALVVLPERTTPTRRNQGRTPRPSRQWTAYFQLVAGMETTTTAVAHGVPEDQASSSLAQLLLQLELAWTQLTKQSDIGEFEKWLEETAVFGVEDSTSQAHRYLDSLDAFLIAVVQEVEELRGSELTPEELERELIDIWRRTYAYASRQEEERLERIWLARGNAIKSQYEDAQQRRQMYRTSLSPRNASQLIAASQRIREQLQIGSEYTSWSIDDKFTFIAETMKLLSEIDSFAFGRSLGRRRNFDEWSNVLRWWLAKSTLERQPAASQITSWYEFVAQNFIYRGTWGLGSIIGLLMDTSDEGDAINALEIDDWPKSGLPWIAFWLKELLTWGTLDPVAAYLLARGDAIDRPRAEADALEYYRQLPAEISSNDRLDPRKIRDWVRGRLARRTVSADRVTISMQGELTRPRESYQAGRISVQPVNLRDDLLWIDPAGYTVAKSNIPRPWPNTAVQYDFYLNVEASTIEGVVYL